MAQRSEASSEKDESSPSQRPGAGAASIASEVVAGTALTGVDQYVRNLVDPKESTALQAARVVEELANQKPELLAPHIERLVALLGAERARVAQSVAHALP